MTNITKANDDCYAILVSDLKFITFVVELFVMIFYESCCFNKNSPR